jgi:hypothetical protein
MKWQLRRTAVDEVRAPAVDHGACREIREL